MATGAFGVGRSSRTPGVDRSGESTGEAEYHETRSPSAVLHAAPVFPPPISTLDRVSALLPGLGSD